jgi:hypothetical protein
MNAIAPGIEQDWNMAVDGRSPSVSSDFLNNATKLGHPLTSQPYHTGITLSPEYRECPSIIGLSNLDINTI